MLMNVALLPLASLLFIVARCKVGRGLALLNYAHVIPTRSRSRLGRRGR